MAKRVKLKISTRLLKKRGRKNFTGAPRQSRNTKAEGQSTPDYKNVSLLKTFMTERGKILPSRISGSDASFQREITKQIKIARMMALLPFTAAN